jgi:hypothetical protein
MGLLDELRKKLGLDKKKPQPTPEPKPAPELGALDYLKILNLLKGVPLGKLGGTFGLSVVIVFFAISGLLAWLVVFSRFVFSLAL